MPRTIRLLLALPIAAVWTTGILVAQGGFTQFTRPLAPRDVLLRGEAVYGTNCASCHAPDLRGTADGRHPNLLRSGLALRDRHGELIGPAIASHTPPINLVQADAVAVAEYIHSVHAEMGRQGRPPSGPTVELDILVGDVEKGQATFVARCGSCHTATGDLRGFAAKFSDARSLQNAWVGGAASAFGGGSAETTATVTMADGSTVQGTLERYDDFIVVLKLPDGTRKAIARSGGVPRVEVRDPRAPHVDAIVKLAHDDVDSSMLHDITAFLWTLK